MKTGQIEPLKLQGFKLVEKNGKKFIYAALDDTRIFYADKTGRCYLDLVMFETPNSEYSDYAVAESKNKDEDIELPIVGNFSNYVKKEEAPKQESAPAPAQEGTVDDLPF